MSVKLLETEFESRAIVRGGSLLFRPVDALALISRAADEGVPILGVDGFFVTPMSTEAPLEHIADYSAAARNGHGCWADAETFVRERSELGMLFEIVLGNTSNKRSNER